ncbi:MAG: universal stress protein [Chloroflexi bacterium]|nr:universal stress protein [Chloroflexota bacterium]
MYQKIMVPLDGSELAECVLPDVESIVNGCGAKEVTLVRAVEPFVPIVSSEGAYISQKDIDKMEAATYAEAENYLGQLSRRLKYNGVKLETVVIRGKPFEALPEYAQKNGIDLIVIATHGRSGISRWVWGSVADRILRSSCVPVLMVRAPGCAPGI